MSKCAFCGNDCDPNAEDTWKQVSAWVTGPKADGATLRDYTGAVAHDDCIKRVREGQAFDQPELPLEFDETTESPAEYLEREHSASAEHRRRQEIDDFNADIVGKLEGDNLDIDLEGRF